MNISTVWESEGDSDYNVIVNKEMLEKLSLKEGDEIYQMSYGGRVFFFDDKEKMGNLIEKLSKHKIDKSAIKTSQTKVVDGKISFKEYGKELGDMREGALIIKYSKGIAEIKETPEEAKRVKRDETIMNALQESEASIVIDASEKANKVVMRKEAYIKLGVKKGGKIYLAAYGKRIFVFKDRKASEDFVEKLQKAGAAIGKENIKEVEGLYINDEVEINRDDIKELEDLSKGIIVEEYKDDVKEIKSVAQEEKKAKMEKVDEKKLKEAENRRKKPVIKAYKLNVANFGTNEYELTPAAKKIIKKQAEEIREYDYKKITVEGHADSVGKDEINKKISRKRGEVVYKEFLLNGIPVEKITYIGFGSTMPIDTNETKKGRAANRRTEIFVE